jgi:hypothetical protein
MSWPKSRVPFLDMPVRLRARVLVIGLLILLTVTGIRALGPPADWSGPASNVAIVGGLLECVLLALFIALRWRGRPPADELAGTLNRMVSAALVTAMIAVLVVVVLNEFKFRPKPAVRHQLGSAGRPRRIVTTHQATVTASHSDIGVVLRDILVALLIIAIVLVALAAWRRRRPRLESMPELAVDAAAGADLARAVQSGRQALGELDDARAAIIACYVAMEQSLAEAGTERAAAETPDELLARAVEATIVSAGPAGRLTRLFYEARYSTHPMQMSGRFEAERALADLAAELPMGELT